jgi:hypothetical protein
MSALRARGFFDIAEFLDVSRRNVALLARQRGPLGGSYASGASGSAVNNES